MIYNQDKVSNHISGGDLQRRSTKKGEKNFTRDYTLIYNTYFNCQLSPNNQDKVQWLCFMDMDSNFMVMVLNYKSDMFALARQTICNTSTEAPSSFLAATNFSAATPQFIFHNTKIV